MTLLEILLMVSKAKIKLSSWLEAQHPSSFLLAEFSSLKLEDCMVPISLPVFSRGLLSTHGGYLHSLPWGTLNLQAGDGTSNSSFASNPWTPLFLTARPGFKGLKCLGQAHPDNLPTSRSIILEH